MPGILHVIRQRRRQPLAVARFKCGDHVFMIGDRRGPFFRTFVADIADAPQSRL